MKIAIFGSCVSRDTANIMPEAEVVAYVARHSVTSLERPHGTTGIDLSELTSAFQKRMVTSDLKGTGVETIVKNANNLDVVLLDLVDERRGFWNFPDGTTITNSIEFEACGGARIARRDGARLIEFGTDKHFDQWQSGFGLLIDRLKNANLWKKTILLDLEWAAAIDGVRHPRSFKAVQLGRIARNTRRTMQKWKQAIAQGNSLATVRRRIQSVQPTESETYAMRAFKANSDYRRYRKYASSMVKNAVSRKSNELRIDPEHKWGPQPFHYTLDNYKSVREEILETANSFK